MKILNNIKLSDKGVLINWRHLTLMEKPENYSEIRGFGLYKFQLVGISVK